MSNRTAVFMGGPFDGQGLSLSEDKHPTISLPLQEPVVFSFAECGVSQPEFTSRYKLARYRLQLVAGLPTDSTVDIYFFEELS